MIFDNHGRLTVLGERNVLLKLYNTEYSRYVFFSHFSEVNVGQRFITIGVGSGIMNHIMNFCFKNLGIMNLVLRLGNHE